MYNLINNNDNILNYFNDINIKHTDSINNISEKLNDNTNIITNWNKHNKDNKYEIFEYFNKYKKLNKIEFYNISSLNNINFYYINKEENMLCYYFNTFKTSMLGEIILENKNNIKNKFSGYKLLKNELFIFYNYSNYQNKLYFLKYFDLTFFQLIKLIWDINNSWIDYYENSKKPHLGINKNNIFINNNNYKIGKPKLSEIKNFISEKPIINKNFVEKIIVKDLIYWAPEIIISQNIRSNSDLWSIGILLFFVICKKYPLNIDSEKNFLQNIFEKKINFKILENNLMNFEFKKRKLLINWCKKLLVFNFNHRINIFELKEYIYNIFSSFISINFSNAIFKRNNFLKIKNYVNQIKLKYKANKAKKIFEEFKFIKKPYFATIIQRKFRIYMKNKKYINYLRNIKKYKYLQETKKIRNNFLILKVNSQIMASLILRFSYIKKYFNNNISVNNPSIKFENDKLLNWDLFYYNESDDPDISLNENKISEIKNLLKFKNNKCNLNIQNFNPEFIFEFQILSNFQIKSLIIVSCKPYAKVIQLQGSYENDIDINHEIDISKYEVANNKYKEFNIKLEEEYKNLRIMKLKFILNIRGGNFFKIMKLDLKFN